MGIVKLKNVGKFKRQNFKKGRKKKRKRNVQ